MPNEQLLVLSNSHSPDAVGAQSFVVWKQTPLGLRRIMIDCGYALKKNGDWGMEGYGPRLDILKNQLGEGELVDALLLTHTHLDHIGYVPIALKQGFFSSTARFWGSQQDCAVGSLVFSDGQTKKAAQYDMLDCAEAKNRFSVIKRPGRFEPLPGLSVTAIPNGHNPGSKSFIIDRLLIMGDWSLFDQANVHGALMPSHWPEEYGRVEHIVGEFTYAATLASNGFDARGSIQEKICELGQRIVADCSDGKTVVVSVMANGKGQNIPISLSPMLRSAGIPCYIHGNLAIQIADICHRYQWSDQDVLIPTLGEESGIYPIAGREEPAHLLDDGQPKVIFASGGMGDFGAIVPYLHHGLGNQDFVFIFTNYLAPGSTGDRLCSMAERYPAYEGNEAKRQFKIKDNNRTIRVPVRATVRHISIKGHSTFADFIVYLEELCEREKKKVFKSLVAAHTSHHGMQEVMARLQPYFQTIVPGLPGVKIPLS